MLSLFLIPIILSPTIFLGVVIITTVILLLTYFLVSPVLRFLNVFHNVIELSVLETKFYFTLQVNAVSLAMTRIIMILTVMLLVVFVPQVYIVKVSEFLFHLLEKNFLG